MAYFSCLSLINYMGGGKIWLNLGCGFVYMPGYVNVDRFDACVADVVCNVEDLPFKSNTVELIESCQLVEHFDFIHLRYVLGEWFRVLEPEGTLILEMPDLEKTFKKFISADLETQKTTLQWVYGIDSPGMRHKTGFSFNLLKNLMEETGFEGILRETSRTHMYEPGLRVACRKPRECFRKQFLVCFRKRLKSRLEIDDSYLLLPLEGWIRKAFDVYVKAGNDVDGCVNEMISKTVICNPHIPLAFLEECVNYGFLDRERVRGKIDLLDRLVEVDFHKKIFCLWMKSKKNSSDMEKEFNDFISRLESLMLEVLDNPGGCERRLEYILNLDSADIKFFDFHLIAGEAERLFYKGVKQFHEKNFLKALNLFQRSSKLNPKNPFVYWNMARLEVILGYEIHMIAGDYGKAAGLLGNKGNMREIETELAYLRNNEGNPIPAEPVWVDR